MAYFAGGILGGMAGSAFVKSMGNRMNAVKEGDSSSLEGRTMYASRETGLATDASSGGNNKNINILLTREKELGSTTLGSFSITDSDGTVLQEGYMLEPAGPSSTVSGKDKRIPVGDYSVGSYKSSKFGDSFIISNSDVSVSRGILIHKGNYHSDTSGCLLPGSSYGTSDGNYHVLRDC